MNEFAPYWMFYVLASTFHFVLILFMFSQVFKKIEELKKCLKK